MSWSPSLRLWPRARFCRSPPARAFPEPRRIRTGTRHAASVPGGSQPAARPPRRGVAPTYPPARGSRPAGSRPVRSAPDTGSSLMGPPRCERRGGHSPSSLMRKPSFRQSSSCARATCSQGQRVSCPPALPLCNNKAQGTLHGLSPRPPGERAPRRRHPEGAPGSKEWERERWARGPCPA